MLDRGRHRVTTEENEGPAGAPFSDPRNVHRETPRSLSSDQLARLESDIEHAIAGGPYEAEVSGGPTRCELELTSAGAMDPFFRIEKDSATTHDALSELMRDLMP